MSKEKAKEPNKKFVLNLQAFSTNEYADQTDLSIITGTDLLSNSKKEFFNLPSSSSTDMVMRALSAGDNFDRLTGSAKKVNHSQTITVASSGNKRQIIAKSNNVETTIEINDLSKILGNNKNMKKLLSLILSIMNDRAINEYGNMYNDEIVFPLQELIDLGMYSSIRAARRGFLQSMDNLTSIKIKATVKQGKKTIDTASNDENSGILVLFTSAAIVNNQCIVTCNYKVNWQPLFQFFTILPKFGFTLGNKAFDLFYTIWYLARQSQNLQKIKNNGYFDISFRALQSRLNLPNEDKTLNPTRDIRSPIEDSINEILTAVKNAGDADIFTIKTHFARNGSIRDYLSDGYMRVFLKDKYAQPFIAANMNKTLAIQKKDAIVNKAKALNMAKKLEKEE